MQLAKCRRTTLGLSLVVMSRSKILLVAIEYIIFPALNLAIGFTSASPLNEVNEIDIEVSNSL